MDKAQAQELAGTVLKRAFGCDTASGYILDILTDALLTAYRRGEEDMRERAACAAEEVAIDGVYTEQKEAANHITTAIRSLPSGQET